MESQRDAIIQMNRRCKAGSRPMAERKETTTHVARAPASRKWASACWPWMIYTERDATIKSDL